MPQHERRKEDLGAKIESICEEINRRHLGRDEDELSVLSDSLGNGGEEDVDDLERSLERAESEVRECNS